MGQAKRRGTFEERLAQAIKEGRIKKEKEAWTKPPSFRHTGMLGALMALSMGMENHPFGLTDFFEPVIVKDSDHKKIIKEAELIIENNSGIIVVE